MSRFSRGDARRLARLRRRVPHGQPDLGHRRYGGAGRLDLATGASRQLTHNAAPEADPFWSPDGESVVFFAVRLDRWELGNGDLWRLDVATGETRNLTPGHTGRFTQAIADPDRLAIGGWSYGAILAGYTLTTTTRFKAASLGAMVSDWVSEYGAGAHYDLELWFLGGNPWTNPEHWRERSNLTHADRVRTPTLLHHGDEDETDAPFHSMNYFAALRTFGTPARLIRYPGEPHDFRQPLHLRLRDTQDVAWMQWFVRGVRSPEIPDELGGPTR